MLLIPVVYAAEDYNDYNNLDLKFSLNSNVKITVQESNYEVEFVKGDVSFYPRSDDRQTVQNFHITGETETADKDFIRYSWINPSAGKYEFGLDSVIRTKNLIYPISKKISFPIRDNEYLEYTEPTKYIDLTPEIEDQARNLIAGDDDLYKAVYDIAEWVRGNVNYNLSTLTEEVVQPSSWVLKHKEGVCDEITNLFISMLRSVGIPARFVSGMAYTNIEDNWGNHGWAEVFFPGHGWVPYDVTYGQYGWIDVTHIKLKESKDSGSPSAEYTWRAKGVKIDLGELVTNVSLIKTGEKINSPIEFSIFPLRELIGFGSFVPLEVNVKNLNDFYVVADLFVVKAPGLVGSNSKRVLLKPKEEKSVYWILSVDKNLDPNYIYTASLAVKDSFGGYKESVIRYSKDGRGYTRQEAEKILDSLSGRDEKKISTSTGLKCTFGKEYYYSNESAKMNCIVKNLEGKTKRIDVCYRVDCKQINLDAGAQESLTFDVDASIGGRVIVSAESGDGVKYDYINLNVVKVAEVYIENFKPESINFAENAVVSFTLKTNTPIRNIEVDSGYGKLKVPDFDKDVDIKYSISARALVNGVKFKVSYQDEKDAKYEQNLAFNVEVKNIPWYFRFIYWIQRLF